MATRLATTIKALSEKDGFDFGKVWHGKEQLAVIVPIIRTGKIPKQREYVLVEEVPDKVDVKDSGMISEVIVKGTTEKPIFFRSGILLEGKGTQSRAVEGSKIIMPEKEDTVNVKCVHMSHSIAQDSKFKISGSTPISVQRALLKKSQSEVWANVNTFSLNALGGIEDDEPSHRSFTSPRMSMSTGRHQSGFQSSGRLMGHSSVQSSARVQTDNLVGTLQNDEYTKTLDKFIRELPSLENQVGIIVIDQAGVLGLEIFDHPDSWKAASANVIRKYGEVFSKPAKVPFKIDIADERVPEIIAEFLKAISTSGTKDGKGTHQLESPTIYGEYTILGDGLIHLIALRRETTSSDVKAAPRQQPDSTNSDIGLSSLIGTRSRTSRPRWQMESSSFLESSSVLQSQPTPSFELRADEKGESIYLSGWSQPLLMGLDAYSIKNFPQNNPKLPGNRSKAVRKIVADHLFEQGYL